MVTDANLVLGRINPHYVLGGRLKIDAQLSRAAMKKQIADPMGLSVEAAAQGVISVVNSNMARGPSRVITVEKGHNPSDFTLVAYGGAGPLHAVHLAPGDGHPHGAHPTRPRRSVRPGSADGQTCKKSYVKTALIPYDQATPEQINQAVLPLMEEGSRWLASENVPEQRRQFHNVAEMRYVGQNYELQVEIPAGLVDQADLDRMKEDFFRAHEMNYGYYNPNAPVQFVNFRSEAIGQVQKPRLAELTGHMETPSGAVIDHRDVYFEESGLVRCPVYDRSKFGRCPRVDGPCIVEQMDSTTVIPPNTWFEVDIHGNLIVNAFGDGKGGDEA